MPPIDAQRRANTRRPQRDDEAASDVSADPVDDGEAQGAEEELEEPMPSVANAA